ncbi:hypothetical protein AC481_05785 [miscellaneous Crenarchaeota group archaeon SMTZ-80]|nr:MAG: hypothetical protein AC481_05785 [miscellaneous Crenarchaeota group archaeon SMTZ-80]
MKKLGVFISIFLTSILLLMPIAPVQSNSVYLHSYTATPPIIDGNLNSFSGEWANAATQEFDTIGGTSKHGKIYVMNTQSDLFIAVEINDGTNNGISDFIQIIFDNDNDGTAVVGDDALMLRDLFYDMYISSASGFTYDPIKHGSGAASFGTSWTFEISHPLSSGEIGYDFQLSIGSIVGFTIRYYDGSVGESHWPGIQVFAGSNTENYGDIGIDPPTTTNPVGGIYAPNDKLNILTPFIALVGLIGAVSTIFAIRRWRKD